MFFFFSSRRRHTRSKRDWSSDVCSSDLELQGYLADYPASKSVEHLRGLLAQVVARLVRHELYVASFYLARSEERRVGKEWREPRSEAHERGMILTMTYLGA